MPVNDLLEQALAEGDFICYAVRDGNSGGMRFGMVIGEPTNDPEEKSFYKRVQVPIIGAENWNGWRINTRKSVLSIPSRIVKVQAEQVPSSLLALFADWKRDNLPDEDS